MKIRVAFTVDLTQAQLASTIAYARELGFDGPTDRQIVKKLLREHGRDAIGREAESNRKKEEA